MRRGATPPRRCAPTSRSIRRAATTRLLPHGGTITAITWCGKWPTTGSRRQRAAADPVAGHSGSGATLDRARAGHAAAARWPGTPIRRSPSGRAIPKNIVGVATSPAEGGWPRGCMRQGERRNRPVVRMGRGTMRAALCLIAMLVACGSPGRGEEGGVPTDPPPGDPGSDGHNLLQPLGGQQSQGTFLLGQKLDALGLEPGYHASALTSAVTADGQPVTIELGGAA